MRRLLLGALVLAASVAAGACGSGDKNGTSSGDVEVVSSDTTNNTSVSGVLVGGGSFVLEDAIAIQPVALWFWAPG
jgi:hypothetical protein